ACREVLDVQTPITEYFRGGRERAIGREKALLSKERHAHPLRGRQCDPGPANRPPLEDRAPGHSTSFCRFLRHHSNVPSYRAIEFVLAVRKRCAEPTVRRCL